MMFKERGESQSGNVRTLIVATTYGDETVDPTAGPFADLPVPFI